MKIPRRLRGYAYQTFYRLPGRVRRRLVRIVVPKYLVGAVAIVRDADAADPGRLLLLRQPPGRGWGLPAGLLKKHEPPAVGAARELYEESGVRIDPDDLVPARPNAIVHTRGWVDMVYFGQAPAATTALTVDGGEVLEARWFPMDDLPPLTRDTELLLGLYGIGPAAARVDPDAVTRRGLDDSRMRGTHTGVPQSGDPQSGGNAGGPQAGGSQSGGPQAGGKPGGPQAGGKPGGPQAGGKPGGPQARGLQAGAPPAGGPQAGGNAGGTGEALP